MRIGIDRVASAAASQAHMRFLALAAALLVAAGVSGCSAVAHDVLRAQRNWNRTTVTVTDKTEYSVTDALIKAMPFKGPVEADRVEVFHLEGQETLAGELAREMSATLAGTSERIGLPWNHRLRVYIFPVDEIPRYLESDITAEGAVLAFPFFVRRDARTLAEALKDNGDWAWYVTHEMAESTLLSRGDGPELLSDASWGPFTLSFGTRWFREGLSDYAGRTARTLVNEHTSAGMEEATVADFGRLDKVGTGLFRWSNGSDPGADERAYNYGAALALFLLIEEKFGPDAVPRVVRALSELDYADGKAVIRVMDRTLGTDVVRIVRDLKWPYVGAMAVRTREGKLIVFEVVEGGPAQKAGLRVGDALLSIEGREASDLPQMQLAILAAMDKGQARLRVRRGDETLDLPLDLTAPRPKPRKESKADLGVAFITTEARVEVRHWKKRR